MIPDQILINCIGVDYYLYRLDYQVKISSRLSL